MLSTNLPAGSPKTRKSREYTVFNKGETFLQDVALQHIVHFRRHHPGCCGKTSRD